MSLDEVISEVAVLKQKNAVLEKENEDLKKRCKSNEAEIEALKKQKEHQDFMNKLLFNKVFNRDPPAMEQWDFDAGPDDGSYVMSSSSSDSDGPSGSTLLVPSRKRKRSRDHSAADDRRKSGNASDFIIPPPPTTPEPSTSSAPQPSTSSAPPPQPSPPQSSVMITPPFRGPVPTIAIILPTPPDAVAGPSRQSDSPDNMDVDSAPPSPVRAGGTGAHVISPSPSPSHSSASSSSSESSRSRRPPDRYQAPPLPVRRRRTRAQLMAETRRLHRRSEDLNSETRRLQRRSEELNDESRQLHTQAVADHRASRVLRSSGRPGRRNTH